MFDMSARSSSVAIALAASLVGGCVIPKSVGEGPDAGDGSSSSGSVDGTEPTTEVTSTSGVSGEVPGTTGGPDPSGGTDPASSDETGLTFIQIGDGAIYDPCDIWSQDCPDGEKCVPWSDDGITWNTWRCSPIVEEPDAVGEPCIAEGSGFSGIDTCDFGALCWEVDPETVEGTCVAQCTGPEDLPTCPGTGTTCVVANDGVLALCLPSCDPLLQDCDPGHACYAGEGGFACLPEGLGGPGEPGDSCEGTVACAQGNTCVSPEHVPDCGGSFGCCTAFCALSDPMPACLPGQVCTPWFEAGMAPAGYEDVGFCALPM